MTDLIALIIEAERMAQEHNICAEYVDVPEEAVPVDYKLKETFADGAKLFRKKFGEDIEAPYVQILTKPTDD